jgi:hypothetical protein
MNAKTAWIVVGLIILFWFLWNRFVIGKVALYIAVGANEAKHKYERWKSTGEWDGNLWRKIA